MNEIVRFDLYLCVSEQWHQTSTQSHFMNSFWTACNLHNTTFFLLGYSLRGLKERRKHALPCWTSVAHLLLFVRRTRLPLAGSCIGLDLSQWRVSIHKQKIYGACACMKEAAAWWWWWCRSLYWSSLFRAAFAVRRSSHGVYGTGTRSLAYQARCRLNYHSKARRFPFVSVSRIRTFFSDL